MDRRAGACGASFLPSWPSFECLSAAFRTDSLVLAICNPFTGTIDGENKAEAERSKGQSQKFGSPAKKMHAVFKLSFKSLSRSLGSSGIVGNFGAHARA